MSEDFNSTRIHNSFGCQSMMATFGAQITALAEGHCEITTPIQDSALQQGGAAHAGLSLMPKDRDVVTTEINLLAPAIGDCLVATG